MDVTDGEDIAVLSQGHLVKVKLIGVASPEKSQSYAAIARQHLADLILNKFVVVRYSALRDGYIVGQVLLEKVDIGAQMLRDGVGWYNKSDETLLSDIDRQIYQGSQDAARSERRGLWQDESPVAPWDVRKAQLVPVARVAPAPVATYNTTRQHLPPLAVSSRRGTQAGLSSEDLLGGVVRPGSAAGKPDVKPISSDGVPGRLMRYQPADKHFSILIPSDGLEVTFPVLNEQGVSIDAHSLIGHNEAMVFMVMWIKRSNGYSTDDSAAEATVKGALAGITRVGQANGGLMVNLAPGRSLKYSGYAGRQYALEVGPLSGTIRVLSKQIGDQREIFMLFAMNATENATDSEAEAQFFNSLRIANSRQQTADISQ